MFCPADMSPFPWMRFAFQEYGVRAIRDRRHSADVVKYLRSVGASRHGDETAWCSALVNWCVTQAGLRDAGRPNARSWLTWQEAALCLGYPSFGAIAILWREHRTSWKGHVGFYVGAQGDRILLLGGDQGHAGSISSYSRSRLLGYRWPARFPNDEKTIGI